MKLRLVLPLCAFLCSGLLFVGLHLRGDGVLAALHDPLNPATVPDSDSDLSARVAPGSVAERAPETGASAPRPARGHGETAWLEVVDPQGLPAAGVPVVRATELLRSGWRSLGTTGPSGRLELPRTTETGLMVAAKLGLGDLRSPPLEIPPEALAANQVTQLRLPLGTGLELRLVGAEQKLLDVPGTAKLSLRRDWRKTPLSGGRARFDALLPGGTMRAALQLGSGGPRFSKRVETPTTLGERRVIDFSIGVQTLIRARLQGEGGRPLTNSRIVVRLLGEDTSPKAETYRTDGEGRCLFLVEGSAGSAPFSLDIQARSLRGVTKAVRQVAIPSLPRGGILSLGKIRLHSTDLLAAGLVLDAEGVPAASAHVSVDVQTAEDGEWTPSPELSTRTSRGGSFVVRGLSGSRSLRLWARSEGHYDSEPVICENGETDVTLGLRGLGSLSPSFDWSWGDPEEFLTLRLTHQGRQTYRSGTRGGTFQKLQPGTYELTLLLRGTNRLVLSLPDLEVPIGGPCTDALLHPIRLDGLLAVVKLTVIDSDGSPIADASAGMTAVGGTWKADPSDRGRIRIPTPLQGSLVVIAPGCRPVEIPPPIGDETVTLERLRSVVLLLTEELPDDWDGWLFLSSDLTESWAGQRMVIRVSGQPLDPQPWRLTLSSAEVDGRTIHPPGPGSYRATWYEWDPTAQEGRNEIRDLGGIIFELTDGEGPLEIVLPLPMR